MLDSCAHVLDKLYTSLARALKVGNHDGLKMKAESRCLTVGCPCDSLRPTECGRADSGSSRLHLGIIWHIRHSGYTAKFRECDGGWKVVLDVQVPAQLLA